jgi:hypothetical protein
MKPNPRLGRSIERSGFFPLTALVRAACIQALRPDAQTKI